jgi:hypothetical protein
MKILFIFFVLGSLGGAGILLTQEHDYSDAEIIHSQGSFVVDVTNDRELVGISHNVFVGKVIAQVGTETVRPIPHTQFSVEVLENIKGKLSGEVVVNQLGGYETVQGKDYLVLPEGDDKLLIPGETYLFATRTGNKDMHTCIAGYGNILLDNASGLQAQKERFETAYAEEIPWAKEIKKEASKEQQL